ncbi:Hemocyanin N domain containing protein, partial [Asbolus verrucosus]
MRFLLVALLAGLCAVSAVSVGNVDPEYSGKDTGNYSQKQKDVWRLFKYINQPSYYKDHVEIANNYNFYENKELYNKPEAIEEFYNYYKYGKLLQRGEIFSVFYEEHLEQAIALFKLFYYANNWETLYKTAVWARNNVNEGVFLYSFSVALIHRPDTYYIVLPPIYEIYPYYFYNTEVIQEAQYYKQLYYGQNARYYLERLSNGFGEIDYFNWEVPLKTGYYPSLSYPNGLQFPTRPNYVYLYEYFYNYGQKYGANKYAYSYTHVQDYERRIRDAIDSGYAYTKSGSKVDVFSQEGINILGNLIEGNPDSPYYQYYGGYQVFARHLLGYSYQPLDYQTTYPSALEHFETSLRDPVFYQLYKKLILYFYKYKNQLPYYTQNDLIFSGINVKNVEFDRLVTYFDYFYADLSNAVYVTPEEFVQDKFKVQVAQERLNHKPFTYKIYVDSDKDVEAVVKVFLGPKYDEYGRYINLTENWMNF